MPDPLREALKALEQIKNLPETVTQKGMVVPMWVGVAKSIAAITLQSIEYAALAAPPVEYEEDADVDAATGTADDQIPSHIVAAVRQLLDDPDECAATLAQPLPVPQSSASVWRLVIADMEAREALGKAQYGTILQINNGRDHLIDAYQEALDLAVYLKQEIEQRKHDTPVPLDTAVRKPWWYRWGIW